ncbi:MAG: response regulator [Anaerolineaceae bacterium]|nr:response regulator [Anaerolineaceae bacterium]MCB9100145.1 response regulator [Anaerolineales bacterium]
MKNQSYIGVLIAEDDYLVSKMIRGKLEQTGYIIVGEAADGRQAVDLTRTVQPDVVLMDIEMPHLNGIEAAEVIQQHCPTPVVILTAYDTPELILRASEAGVGAYLRKPPHTKDLQIAITVAMARFGDLMELDRLNDALELRNTELQAALDQIKTLKGLLPICAQCKKIRDDEGYWHEVEVYIREHSNADFSHGICPSCLRTLYPDFYSENS